MQKLFFFLTLLFPFWLSAQTFVIQGTVTDNTSGAPIPNHAVTIVTSPGSNFVYSNTVYTNALGFYADTIALPANTPQISFVVSTLDCNNLGVSYNTYYYTNGPNPQVVDFSICGAGLGGCQAYYSYTVNGGVVAFTNQSQGGSYYNWNFGNGQTSSSPNPVYTYTQTGWYNVCLTVYDSTCQDTYCDSIYVTVGGAGNCQADFVASVSGATASFTNTSTGTNPNTMYTWDFGDGTNSSLMNPTHTYTTNGAYTVCLYISVNLGGGGGFCTDTFCQTIYITGVGGCQAYFTYTISGGTVTFTNQSVGGTNYNWNFGNGQTSTVTNPTQTYTQTGWYYVCLLTYGGACQSQYCDSIYINLGGAGNCQAAFIATVSGMTAAFTNTSTGTNNNTTYSWDFGNGATSNLQNPTYVYTSPGVYTVCLTITVTSPGGPPCISSICQTITIQGGGGCQAYFTYTANGGTVSFTNQSLGGTFYNWSFGNGQTSNVANPTETYAQTGWYNVCLTIYDTVGCQSTYCDSVYVTVGGAGCQANFVATVSGTTAAFTNTSTGTTNGTTYSWNFGNGATSTLQNPTYTYTTSGTYNVCLTITVPSSVGGPPCVSTYCQTITITAGGPCQAYFTYTVNGGTVTFTNQSVGGSNNNWNFGNGQTSTLANPTQTYTQTGWYNVCLVIYGGSCQSSYCDSVYINLGGGNCQANFSTTVSGLTATFTNTSTGTNPNTTYTWSFGDGGTSSLTNPNHTYANQGTYTVCLIINVNLGPGGGFCTDTFCQSINVVNVGGCQAYFTYTANGGVVNFTNQSQGGSFYNWSFGNGQTSSAANPTQTYTQTGWYNVCLTVYDSTCQSTYCDSVYVTVGGNCQAYFTYTVNGGTVTFTNQSVGGTNNNWNFGNGQTSTVANPTQTYTQTGWYNVCLVIYGGSCQSSYCDSVYVNLAVGIENAFVSTISDLYPNPTQGQTSFNIDLKEKANIKVEVLNMIGQQISTQNIQLLDGSHQVSINSDNLSQGMYFVRISAEGQLLVTKRFVKE